MHRERYGFDAVFATTTIRNPGHASNRAESPVQISATTQAKAPRFLMRRYPLATIKLVVVGMG